MIYPVIDVGSNTVRLCVYEYTNGQVKTLFTKKAMLGLASQTSHGRLTQNGVEKLCDTLQKFQDTLHNFETQPVSVFATASLRNVENAQQVVDIVEKRTGLRVEIISGEDEARMDFVGATQQIVAKDGILIDIGGGSTELVLFENGTIKQAVSMPIGSLNTYVDYVDGFLPTKKERQQIKKAVEAAVEAVLKDHAFHGTEIVCGVGGTVRAVCKVSNHIFNLPTGYQRVSRTQLDEVHHALTDERDAGIEIILDVVPDRLRTIVTGLTILRTLMKYFDAKELQVSSFGVREGYFYTRVLEQKGN